MKREPRDPSIDPDELEREDVESPTLLDNVKALFEELRDQISDEDLARDISDFLVTIQLYYMMSSKQDAWDGVLKEIKEELLDPIARGDEELALPKIQTIGEKVARLEDK